METELEAVNGRRVRAIEVFAHALHFFREHALKVNFKGPAYDCSMMSIHCLHVCYFYICFASHDVAVL